MRCLYLSRRLPSHFLAVLTDAISTRGPSLLWTNRVTQRLRERHPTGGGRSDIGPLRSRALHFSAPTQLTLQAAAPRHFIRYPTRHALHLQQQGLSTTGTVDPAGPGCAAYQKEALCRAATLHFLMFQLSLPVRTYARRILAGSVCQVYPAYIMRDEAARS